MSIIYCATNQMNGKRYIGQTWRTIKERKKEHEDDSRGKSNGYFTNAIRKHGKGVFRWEILFDNIQSQDEMNELEIDSIRIYRTLYPNGYNLREGGSGGLHSEKSKEIMREAAKSRPPSTEETRKKISQAKKGKKTGPQSPERKRKISKALKKRLKYVEHNRKGSKLTEKHKVALSFKGKKHTEESKKKMSKSAKARGVNYSKLKPEQVIEIRELYVNGLHTLSSLSEMFGVDRTNIWSIVKRHPWKDLP